MGESAPLSPVIIKEEEEKRKQAQRNKERCQKFCRMYQQKFRDIEYVSSDELLLLEMTTKVDHNIVLVDVRTNPERQVSMIEGAITKEEFSEQVHALPKNAQVVTYCTIGYRSGLEARRLQMLYPQFKDRIKSLDGIVSYTHALGETIHSSEIRNNDDDDDDDDLKPQNQDSTTSMAVAAPRKILSPQTGQTTKNVHTFGSIWGLVDEKHFEATHFSIPELLIRLVEVSGSILSCFCLRMKHFCLVSSNDTLKN